MTQIKEVMTTDLQTITPEATIQTAARRMKEHDIGILPVITNEGRAVGTITDRDIAIHGVANGRAPTEAKVLDVMSTGVEFCHDDDNIEQLARSMGEKQLRRMIVVDRESKGIKGIVSLGDLASKGGNSAVAGDALAKCVHK